MTAPAKPWENNLQNSSQILRTTNSDSPPSRGPSRMAPVLPPRPMGSSPMTNSYMPYSSGLGYGSSFGSYGMPYRSSLYGGGYGTGYNYGSSYGYGTGMYGATGMYGYPGNGMLASSDAERRFIQYAEESSRNTFANVEGIVRAFNSLAMMLDNTFFAMTSSFRAVLGVAENFGRLRTMFGHIWYSINVFRLVTWLYRKLLQLLGFKVPQSATSVAWRQAAAAGGSLSDGAAAAGAGGGPKGSAWPTFAFLGVILSAPYIISRFLPKYEDKSDPVNWKTSGVKAKAAFDFPASAPNELSLCVNDEVTLAPSDVQEEMNLKNSGWAFAICNGRSGVVPLNYLVLTKPNYSAMKPSDVPVGRGNGKTHTKRVSFGENQIFENVDLEDYFTGKKVPPLPKVERREELNVKNHHNEGGGEAMTKPDEAGNGGASNENKESDIETAVNLE